ncbi:hypothetical protein HYALB_00008260 [Hymenoscyphus albidus]|uniref:Uncharacterized protein n=1 Tax=Hymenoscyphus albidus TaxID=595503 RepID=A0A9N9PZ69_9HELO|nr:hypothetical protein HYALB_00008260 [Hymenoscyphus albidus]
MGKKHRPPPPSPELVASRIFKPDAGIKQKLSAKFNPATGLATLQYEGSDEVVPTNQLLVQVTSATKGGQKKYIPVVSSWGIFYGRNSPYNLSHCSPNGTSSGSALARGISNVLLNITDENLRPKTAVPIQNVVIRISGPNTYKTLTDDVWHWNMDSDSQWESLIINIHKSLLKVMSESNISVRLQLVDGGQCGGAKHLAEKALNNSEIYQKTNPDTPSPAKAPPISAARTPNSQPGLPWALADTYASSDPGTKNNVERVILRLEYPLGAENEWSRSVQSFLIRRALHQWNGDSDLNETFRSMFGPDSIERVDRERQTLVRQIQALQIHLAGIPDDFAFAGAPDFIKCHATIAEAATVLGKIEKELYWDILNAIHSLYTALIKGNSFRPSGYICHPVPLFGSPGSSSHQSINKLGNLSLRKTSANVRNNNAADLEIAHFIFFELVSKFGTLSFPFFIQTNKSQG